MNVSFVLAYTDPRTLPEVSDRNLAVTLKVDDRVFSFSAWERGETQRGELSRL